MALRKPSSALAFVMVVALVAADLHHAVLSTFPPSPTNFWQARLARAEWAPDAAAVPLAAATPAAPAPAAGLVAAKLIGTPPAAGSRLAGTGALQSPWTIPFPLAGILHLAAEWAESPVRSWRRDSD